MTAGEREWSEICRFVGWLFVAVGGGVLSLLIGGYVASRWSPVEPADIAMSYSFLFIATVGPCAAGMLATGAWLLCEGRTITKPPQDRPA